MNKKIIIGLFLLLIISVYGCARGGSHGTASALSNHAQGQAVRENVGVNQGNLAPDFNIKTIDGKSLSLSS